VINPVAAVSITDRQLRRDIREVLNEIGVQQFNCQNLNYVRFLPRKTVLCAISDLPGEVMAVTALGFDGIIYTQFGNRNVQLASARRRPKRFENGCCTHETDLDGQTSMKITVYGKPNCVQCHYTRTDLEDSLASPTNTVMSQQIPKPMRKLTSWSLNTTC
jgi:hypothetical protein